MRDLKDAVGDLPQTTARIVELIQVAAVAVANIEVELYGESHADGITLDGGEAFPVRQADVVLEMVRMERERQDELWGVQSGSPVERLMILLEEVGEVAEEVSIPARQPEDSIVEGARELGRRAKAWLES